MVVLRHPTGHVSLKQGKGKLGHGGAIDEWGLCHVSKRTDGDTIEPQIPMEAIAHKRDVRLHHPLEPPRFLGDHCE